MASQNPNVSFVIIAYNEERNIAAAISAVEALDELGEYEIVVVDDGSRDGTAAAVEEKATGNDNIRLIRQENQGRGHARGVGIAAARGALIATIDADIVVPRDWLAQCRKHLEEHSAVGGTAVPDGDVAYLFRRFDLRPKVVSATTTVTGNNGLYRREVFDLIKFDPNLREGEDVALNFALAAHGMSSAMIPGLLVRHQETKSLVESVKWLYVSGRGATRQLIVFKKVRLPDLAAAGVVLATVVGARLFIRTRRLSAVLLPSGAVLAVSGQHVRSRFEFAGRGWLKLVPAVATDSLLIVAYVMGRITGVSYLLRAWSR